MEEKLLKIVEHYGIMPQLKYIHSEYFELDEAIITGEHSRYIGITRGIADTCLDHIAEEIADVMVMLEQFRIYYEIPSMKITEIMQQKIDRQLERIEADGDK